MPSNRLFSKLDLEALQKNPAFLDLVGIFQHCREGVLAQLLSCDIEEVLFLRGKYDGLCMLECFLEEAKEEFEDEEQDDG